MREQQQVDAADRDSGLEQAHRRAAAGIHHDPPRTGFDQGRRSKSERIGRRHTAAQQRRPEWCVHADLTAPA
ncbi:MAG: hypothetical protein QHD01_00180 [Bradyrhizobium sp.]|uniref:hypothetical protein n=1 Tax=Bradyrhizobium sp. TaxID=376 RepID=UPI0029A92920|nr:hypothetical protein [Bradyrhizobium sp.]MDX3964994.1 hypothetical protein [Bradyrhizobium sp.]